jgi:Uncharacterized conserved protein
MHEFTKVEKRIIRKYISDPKLSKSLTLIRGVMETIWANDAPRIVQNYTDHGEEHSERVACYIEKLLRGGIPSAKFTQQEIYLLLAGVYLHDIGMQCDVVKYPKIKERAEKLGAEFKITFTAETTNGYSLEEQIEIRKNHHYLSAAWIDYIYEENNPTLFPEIKSIPYDLVNDLMDVCKFHSKLSINDCSNFCDDYPDSRKKLIAALLRFADELDISSTRVKLNTVKTFSINPENSVFWWLHNYTKINLINSNKIHLKVDLHPKDFELYGSLIHKAYIANFINKNQPILNVLVENKVPFVIDDNSDVKSHNRAEKFPPEIAAILDKKKEESKICDVSNIFSACSYEKIEKSNVNVLVESKNSTQVDTESDSLMHKNTEIFFPEITTNSYIKIQNEKLHKELITNDFPKTFISPFTNMEFVLISVGKFMMGSQKGDSLLKKFRYCTELPLHEVNIEYQFYLGKFPVTQKQWVTVMGNNPSEYKGDTKPVERVSWNDAQEFIKRLNDIEETNKYRLPSEAEWEYACKAGTQTMYSFGDDNPNKKDYLWCNGYSGTHPAGQKKPNPWDLYDMHGNVWEWVQDSWHGNYEGAPSDGSAWEDKDGSNRVTRGGSCCNFFYMCTSTNRLQTKVNKGNYVGFRLLREL